GGGGGDDMPSTSAAATGPSITSPNPDSSTRSATTRPQRSRTTPGNQPAPQSLPQGGSPLQAALGPFRDCLRNNGVDPAELGQGGFQQGRPPGQQRRRPDPSEVRRRIHAGFACIPQLPPRLRQTAERLKQRYEQRQQGGGGSG